MTPSRRIAIAVLAALSGGCWHAAAELEPVAWQPPPPALVTPERALEDAVVFGDARLPMPEDVAVDPADPARTIYCGTVDGRIMKVAHHDGRLGEVATFAELGATPLGLRFAPDGTLLACVPGRGLLAIDRGGEARVLAAGVAGRPFRFINDLDVGPDGTVWFTESSTRFGVEGAEPIWAIAENRGDGGLFVYEPKTRTVRQLMSGLHFPNGVTRTSDGRSLLIAETARYTIQRYWLTGPKGGSAELLTAALPGIPDGIMSDGRGRTWVALVPRDGLLDGLAGAPALRGLLMRLPASLLVGMAAGTTTGRVAAIDERDGRVVRALEDATGRFRGGIANVLPVGGALYMGTKWGSWVAMLDRREP